MIPPPNPIRGEVALQEQFLTAGSPASIPVRMADRSGETGCAQTQISIRCSNKTSADSSRAARMIGGLIWGTAPRDPDNQRYAVWRGASSFPSPAGDSQTTAPPIAFTRRRARSRPRSDN